MDILIVRIGRLGDMVMICPALQEIKRLYPKARLHFITSPDGQRLFKTLDLSYESLLVYHNKLLSRAKEAVAIKQFVNSRHFDLIYCFENKKRTISWLPSNAAVLPEVSEIIHYATRCLKLVNPSLEYTHQEHYLNFKEEESLDAVLTQYDITPQTLLIGLHPTYSGFNKWNRKKEAMHRLWPWENFAKLAIEISEYASLKGLDIKIIMDLLPEEQFLGKKIQEASQGKAILLGLKPNFKRYLQLLKRMNLLIVPNTGVMHLAAGVNTPQIALFSQLDPRDCGPYMPSLGFKVLEAKDCPNAALGLAAIGMDQVFKEILSLLRLK